MAPIILLLFLLNLLSLAIPGAASGLGCTWNQGKPVAESLALLAWSPAAHRYAAA